MLATGLTTDQKGAIAETAIIHAAVKLGVGVFKPLTDGERYDLIFDVAGQLCRVQCKWAPRHRDVVVIRCYSSRRTADGLRRSIYAPGEVDAIAGFCPDVDQCFYVPSEHFDGHSQLSLRLGPSRNNQIRGIRWAEEFGFAATLRALLGP